MVVMTRPNSIVAGVGAIAFAVLTFAAIFFVNWPGGGYSGSISKCYVAPGNLPTALAGTSIGLIAVVGLICLLAYLKQAAEVGSSRALPGWLRWLTLVAGLIARTRRGWGGPWCGPDAHLHRPAAFSKVAS